MLRLLRHAKSDWADATLGDRQRPLNRRGERAARAMGRALAGRLPAQPARVSPARRAQLTLEGLCAGWPAMREAAHVTEEALYTFSAASLAAWLRGAQPAEELFLIGHNPAFTELVNWCCGSRVIDNLPTAGFAELRLEIDGWPELAPGCGELRHSLFPRQLEHV